LPFHEAIEVALSKVDEHYKKTGNSNSYALAMGEQIFYVNSHLGPLFVILDPRRKFAYFEKHWPKSLQTSTKKKLEKMV
jgi:hypothetical protein